MHREGAELDSSVDSLLDERQGGRWFDKYSLTFFLMTDNSHCYMIQSSLNTVKYFDDGYVGK